MRIPIFFILAMAVSALAFQAMPNKHLYPPEGVTGATSPTVTQKTIDSTICVKNYTIGVRDVSERLKKQIYERDQMQKKPGVCCEIDHLISLELGGSNDPANLWAQPYHPTPGAHEKDVLENALHKMVCEHQITLKDAQDKITTDWVKAWKEIR